MADESELRLLITAQIAQAKEQLGAIGRDAEKMAEEFKSSGMISDESLNKVKGSIDELKVSIDTIRDAAIKVNADTAVADAKLQQVDEEMRKIPNEKTIRINEKTSSGEGGIGLLGSSIMAGLPLISPLAAAATGAVGGLSSAFAAAAAGVAGFGAVAVGVLKPVFTASSNLTAAQQQYAQAVQTTTSAHRKAIVSVTSAQNQLLAAQQAYNNATTNAGREAAYQRVIAAQKELATAQKGVSTSSSAEQVALAKEKEALSGLSGAQRNAVTSLAQFKSFWQSFANSFQTPVLSMFSSALKDVELLMKDMRPVIESSAKALNGLMKDFGKSLNSSSVKDLFNFLGKEAGPMITDFGESTGNIIKGLLSLFEAFAPVANSMGSGFVKMSADFAKWAASVGKSQSFKDFLNYVKTEGPAVLSLIGNLVKLAVNLLKAWAPTGKVMLNAINGIVQGLNSLASKDPGLFRLAASLVPIIGGFKLLSTGVTSVIKPIENATKFFKDFAVVLKGGQDLSKVGTGARIAGTLFGGLGKVFSVVGKSIISVIRAIGIAMLENPIILVITLIVAAVAVAAYEIIKHWTAVKNFFITVGRDIAAICTSVWNGIKNFFRKWGMDILLVFAPFIALPIEIYKHWDQIQSFFENLGSRIGRAFTNIIRSAYSWGSNFINMFVQGIMSGIHAVENVVSNVANKIKNFLGFHSPTKEGPGAEADTWAPNFVKMYTQGLVQGTPKVQAALKRILEPSATGVVGGVNSGAQNLGASVANSIAQGESAQASQGQVNMEVHFHGVNLSDPQQLKKVAQQLAIYTQQKRLAVGGTG